MKPARAVVWCETMGRGRGAGSRPEGSLHRFGSLEAAIEFAEGCRPCSSWCIGVHIVAYARGRELRASEYVGGNARWCTVIGTRIFDQGQRRRSVAAELKILYPPRWKLDGSRCAPVAPAPEFWPLAPGDLNGPLGPRPVPVQTM